MRKATAAPAAAPRRRACCGGAHEPGTRPPVAPPSPSPRELTTGHPLASRSALLDSAQRIAAAGDTLRAAAIRARLTEGDFQPGERIWMRVDSEPALSDTFTVTTAGTV